VIYNTSESPKLTIFTAVMDELSHINKQGDPTMEDVSGKSTTLRTATAETRVRLTEEILALLKGDEIHTKKGPVFQTAIIAGTQGAKKTADLIPFCHPIGLDDLKISIHLEAQEAVITCTAKVLAKTGVEMEAITGASIAAITIYDMCKAMSHEIQILNTKLISKTGGKSDYKAT
jgi:cyclic pyranopterin phosphate synthase